MPTRWPAEEARYEVRVAATEISGNGYAKLPVFAIGTLADGTPSHEPVLFGVSRAGAGNFADPVATLTASGVTNFYTACNTVVVPGCAGPFQITLALRSDPRDDRCHFTADRLGRAVGRGVVGCMRGWRRRHLHGW